MQARAALLGPSTAGLFLAEEIYGEIARGGFGIILSGIGGAFIAALLIRSNYDEVSIHISLYLIQYLMFVAI